MGKRGPPAKPSALKKREGTYRADRAPEREPEPAPGIGPMPPSVKQDRHARHCWEQLAPILLALRLMTVGDWLVFAGLCRAYSVATQADAHVAQHGPMLATPWGEKANPAVAMSRLAWVEVRKFAAEFGLSPASRTRVNAGAEPDEQDRAEAFLFGAGAGKVVGQIGGA